jgi:hypothetical protein
MFVKEQYEPCPKPAAKAKAPARQAKPAPAGC